MIPTRVVCELSWTSSRRAAPTSAARIEFLRLVIGKRPRPKPRIAIWGQLNPAELELSGNCPKSPKSTPAYWDVLPDMSIINMISTFSDRAAWLATLPLIKIEFWSWVMLEPSLGERICTFGSTAPLAMETETSKTNGRREKNHADNSFIALISES